MILRSALGLLGVYGVDVLGCCLLFSCDAVATLRLVAVFTTVLLTVLAVLVIELVVVTTAVETLKEGLPTMLCNTKNSKLEMSYKSKHRNVHYTQIQRSIYICYKQFGGVGISQSV